VLIHAGLEDDREGYAVLRRILESIGQYPQQGIDPKDLRRGGIVGQAEIVDCVARSASPWFCGPYGFVLRQCPAADFSRVPRPARLLRRRRRRRPPAGARPP
jgi:hypothetical protein